MNIFSPGKEITLQVQTSLCEGNIVLHDTSVYRVVYNTSDSVFATDPGPIHCCLTITSKTEDSRICTNITNITGNDFRETDVAHIAHVCSRYFAFGNSSTAADKVTAQ